MPNRDDADRVCSSAIYPRRPSLDRYRPTRGIRTELFGQEESTIQGIEIGSGWTGTGAADGFEVNEVDGILSGSFDVTLCQSPNGSDFPSDCSNGSRVFSGSFRVMREPQGTAGRGKD